MLLPASSPRPGGKMRQACATLSRMHVPQPANDCASQAALKTSYVTPGGQPMDTFLPPIENPAAPMMKLVYGMSKRQFGKVMTPLKVFVARMPLGFGMFYGKISKLDKKLELPQETQMLVRERVARLNMCLFCIDIGRAFVIKSRLNEAKFDALEDY